MNLLFPPPRKPSLLRRIGLLWTDLPVPVRLGLAIAGIVLLAVLSGCALQQFSPWAGIQLKDEATRAADPSWFGIGQLWIGLKAVF